jgi:hypothetical protein
VRLSLLPAGQAALDGWNRAREEASREVLSGLSANQREELAALLAQGLRGTNRPRAEADTTCRLCDWPACSSRCPVDESVHEP